MEERARVQPAAAKKRRSLRRAFIFSLGGIAGVVVLAALALHVSGRRRLSAAIEEVRASGGKMPPTVEELAERETPDWVEALPEPAPRDEARDELLEALSKPHEDPALTRDLAAGFLDTWAPSPVQQAPDLCDVELVPAITDAIEWYKLSNISLNSLRHADCYFLLGEERRSLKELEQALCSCRLMNDARPTATMTPSLCRTISGMLARRSETFDWQLVRRRLAQVSTPIGALRAGIESERAQAIHSASLHDTWEAGLGFMDLEVQTWGTRLFARHELATVIREFSRLLEHIRPPYGEHLRVVEQEAGKGHGGTFKGYGVFLAWAEEFGEAVPLQAERDLVDLGLLARTEGVEEALRQVEESQDPFTGHPYRTRLEEDGTLVLWSVGPDEFDDGGTCAPLTLWHEPGPDFVVRVHGAGR